MTSSDSLQDTGVNIIDRYEINVDGFLGTLDESKRHDLVHLLYEMVSDCEPQENQNPDDTKSL